MTLAQILHKHNLSDTAVAAALGVTKMSVGNWRRGKSKPTGVNLLRLATFIVAYEPTVKMEELAGVPDKPLPSEAEVFRNMADPEVR